MNNKKFIVTDPCYIMDRAQYEQIVDEGCHFEGLEFPFESSHQRTNLPIVLHTIRETPSGDGSFHYQSRGKEYIVGVDSGMLCIAQANVGDFENEHRGALFDTLAEARRAFGFILKQF